MNSNLRDKINHTDFMNLCKSKGYKYNTDPYKLNIFVIHNLIEGTKQNDQFNDALVITYKENNYYIRRIFDVTSQPGIIALKNPTNKAGTAIVAEGQYNSYKISKHNNKYYALCNRERPISVYRDNNKDDVLDMDPKTIQTGIYCCNIHKSFNAKSIGKNSYGCIVTKNDSDFDTIMKMAYKHKDLYENQFMVTVINSNDLVNK